jgi:WD40 repeat protein
VSVAAHPPKDAGARARRSPYQGLVPYADEDADWFFGRDDWCDIVVDNLRAYRLAVLYGPSGVGKSSLLDAGVVHRMREEARRNYAASGVPELVVVSFASWSSAEPADALKGALRESVEQVAPELAHGAPTGALVDVLSAWSERIEGTLFVILDQFEDYLAYHQRDDAPTSFSEELSLALRRRGTPGNFLISIREDALAQLDRFEGRIPGLLDNLLRIEHLSRKAAQEAIEGPLDRWNELGTGSGKPMEIEPALVEAVLAQVATGKIVVGEAERAVIDVGNGEHGIEAPYLQLVLTHLWAEEERVNSRVLRLATLDRLGGADRIVRTHLDATMDELPPRDREVAAKALRYLVTPSGAKIALRKQDLAEYAQTPDGRLGPVLARLAGEPRILRSVGDETYEIYHDALAGPILDWRARWQEHQRRRREWLRAGLVASAAAVVALVAAGFVVLAVQRQHARDVARSRELATIASAQLENDPQESLRLAVQAVSVSQTEQAEDALRTALAKANIRAVLRGHKEPVASAAFRSDGRFIVTAGNDGTARIWNAESGASVHVLRGHGGRVLGAAFSPNGTLVVTAGADGTARIWDARSGASVRILYHGGDRVFRALFSPAGTLVVTAGSDGTARIWDAESGKRLRVLRGHTGYVRSAAFSPDGRLIVTAGDDGTARIWDAKSGASVHVLAGHTGPVQSAIFSPNGRLVVTAGADGTAGIWDVDTGKRLRVLRGHTGLVQSATFSPNGRLVVTASADRTARVWDAESGRSLTVLRGHGDAVESATFSANGELIVTASADGTARVWVTDSGANLTVLRGHLGAIYGATFSPNGRLVLTASADGTARVWDAVGGASLHVLRHAGFGSAAFSSDGTLIVTAGADGTARIWDVESGQRLRVLPGLGPLYSAAFSPDSKLVVTAGAERDARIWDAGSARSLRVLRGHRGDVFSAVFSPDGKLVVTASADGTARIWNVETGTSLRVLHGGRRPLDGAAFSPDSKLVVTADADGTARIWDVGSGSRLRVLRGHRDEVYSAVFSPDGTLVATASADGTADIWDVESGTRLNVLHGGRGAVYGAAFSPDGSLVVTAGADGTARVWDSRTGVNLTVLYGHRRRVYSATFSPDGTLIATTSFDGTARIFRCEVCGSMQELRSRARQQLARG